MIINPSLPYGFAIFCDDVRHEASGKVTLVGMYHANMTIFGKAPATIAQMFVAVSVRVDPGKLPVDGMISIVDPDAKQPIFETDFHIPADAANINPYPFQVDEGSVRYTEMVLYVPLRNLTVSKDSRLKVRAIIGADELRLGTLAITFAELDIEALV
jgi:hypothetical protein